jgi:succinoglycan biosynthesis transport protein ExoP
MKHDTGDSVSAVRAHRMEPQLHGPSDDVQGHQFRKIAGTLRPRIGLIVAVTAAGTFLVGVSATAIPPSYTSTAAIVVDRPAPARGAAAEEPDEAAIDTQVAMLTSDANLRRVLDSLRTRASTKVESAPPTQTTVDETQTPTLVELTRALKVNKERRSWIITVSYTDKSSDKAAVIANEVVQSHIQNLRERKRHEAERVLAWLDGQLAEAGAAWKQADAAVRQYRTSHNASNTDVADVTFAQMRRQLVLAKSDVVRRQVLLDRVRDLQRRGAGEDSFAEVLGSPTLSEHRREEPARSQEGERPADPADNPQPQSLSTRAPSPQLRAQMAERIDGAITGLEAEVRAARSRVQTIEKQLAAARSEQEMEVQALEHRAASAAKLFDDLTRRRQESAESRDLLDADVHILSPAWRATRPSSINPALFIPPALIAFFLLGGALSVTLERLDQSLRSERDVANTLGVQCIGLIPEITRPQQKLRFVPHDPSSTYGRAIESTVVAALQLASTRRKPKVVLITSSLPGEGKTTLAVSFGECAARLGRRVLLVDLGLRDHAVTEAGSEVDQTDGLKLFLQDPPATNAIRRIADLGIDYLPTRDIGIDAVGLLASEKGPEVFRRLRDSYDCVIIDGPPLFAVEARMLASISDDVVVAVRWGKTRRDVAANAIQLLRHSSSLDCEVLSGVYAVLTRVNLTIHARYRYGDTGEFLRKYKNYYVSSDSVHAPAASASPPARPSPLWPRASPRGPQPDEAECPRKRDSVCSEVNGP